MEHPILVSIIINNYNYGRFLADAINSALEQTYQNTEVIVVDDGSTDHSREIIAGYGPRIIAVLKDNGGQASAFNAGFTHCRGDVIIFLDSDDLLMPNIATTVVDEFAKYPQLTKIQYRLAMIDKEGQPTGEMIPPAQLPLPSGDLSQHMLRFPDDVRTPPTSGNAFAASVLRQILPMPEPIGQSAWADLYLLNLVPLFGPVMSLTTIGGYYRTHGSNHFYSRSLDVERVRKMLKTTQFNRHFIVKHARALELPNTPRSGEDILSVTYLANRIVSFLLDPAAHPIKGDSRLRLARLGLLASYRRFDVRWSVRLVYMVWFLTATTSPRPIAEWLLNQVFYPQRRGLLGKLV